MQTNTNPESQSTPTTTFTMKTTPEGLLSQRCPACSRDFKARPSTEHPVTHCPYCAETGEDRFWTAPQRDFRQACAKYVVEMMLIEGLKDLKSFRADQPEIPTSPDEPADTMPVLALACCNLTVKHDGQSAAVRCPYCGAAAAALLLGG